MIQRLTDELVFPPVAQAEESGMLAVGGDLSVERLMLAYRSGIFPWYSEGYPIQWFSPDPRFVLFPAKLKVSKSLQRTVKANKFTATLNENFRGVITCCQKIPRPWQWGTWITDEMLEAYCRLHEAGHAHSVEVWHDGELAGGLYGVAAGRCFCGESMFCFESNASKVGFVHLVRMLERLGFTMIDCQIPTPHLESFGAEAITRTTFIELLERALRTSEATHWPEGRIEEEETANEH